MILNSYKPAMYTLLSGDLCPKRKGNKINGCPELKISTKSNEVFYERSSEFELDFPNLEGDEILWTCNDCNLVKREGKIMKILPKQVGYLDINVEVNGKEDFFYEKKSKRIHAKILKRDLSVYLSKLLGKPRTNIANQVKFFCAKNCTVINSKSNYPILGDGSLDTFLDIMQSTNISDKVSYLTPNGFIVQDIIYEKKSGKIRQIKIAKRQ